MSNRVFDPRAVQYWRLEVRADGSVAHRGALASQAELGAAHARANASATSRGGSEPGLLLGLGDGPTTFTLRADQDYTTDYDGTGKTVDGISPLSEMPRGALATVGEPGA